MKTSKTSGGIQRELADKSAHVMPPTPEDEALSLKHHKDSVAYNLRHASDHLAGTAEHLDKMRTVGGDKLARAHAKKVAAVLEAQRAKLDPYLR